MSTSVVLVQAVLITQAAMALVVVAVVVVFRVFIVARQHSVLPVVAQVVAVVVKRRQVARLVRAVELLVRAAQL